MEEKKAHEGIRSAFFVFIYTDTTMRLTLLILAAFMSSTNLTAQLFYGVESQNFPILRAYGSPAVLSTAKASDFTVLDNMDNMSATLQKICATTPNNPSVRLVIAIDRSQSMSAELNGRSRLDVIKELTKEFLRKIPKTSDSKFAIISFSGDVVVESNFESNVSILDKAIDGISIRGGTLYDPLFLDVSLGVLSLLKSQPPWINRRAIVITDDQPTRVPSIQTIVAEANKEKVRIDGVSLEYNPTSHLQKIAAGTGGGYTTTYSSDLLQSVLSSISDNIGVATTHCYLQWTVDNNCQPPQNKHDVIIKNNSNNSQEQFVYYSPNKNSPFLAVNPATIPPFGNLSAGNSEKRIIQLQSMFGNTTVNAISINPAGAFIVSDWGGSPPPFTLQGGEQRYITVEFRQDSNFKEHRATLSVDADPCTVSPMELRGGAPAFQIVTPNNGETFSVCNHVDIRWNGIHINDYVDLHYSADEKFWYKIAVNATQYFHRWEHPPAGSWKIRGKAKKNQRGNIWALHFGGAGLDSIAAISASKNNNYFVAAGIFSGTADFAGITLSTQKKTDIYISLINDGKVFWAKKGESILSPEFLYTNPTVAGLLVTEDGKSIFCGTAENNGKRFGYIAALTSSGGILWKKDIRGNKNVQILNINASANGKIFSVDCSADDEVQIMTRTGLVEFPYVPNKYFFTLQIDEIGAVISAQIGSSVAPYNNKQILDSAGYLYTAQTFSQSSVNAGSFSFANRGSSDVWIRCEGNYVQSFDITDAFCTVAPPNLTVSSNIMLPEIEVNAPYDTTVVLFCNKNNVAFVVDSIIADNFIVFPNSTKNISVLAGDCLAVPISFIPKQLGINSTAIRIITKNCDEYSVNISAIGIRRDIAISSAQWGKKRIKADYIDTVYLKNSGTTPVVFSHIGVAFPTTTAFIPIFPLTPFNVDVNDSIPIPVLFNPRDTIAYSNEITAYSPKLSSTIRGGLRGAGFLPLIRTEGYIFQPAYIQSISSEIGILNTANPGATSPTSILSIKWLGNLGDFSLPSLPNFPFSINEESKREINIQFMPLIEGLRTAKIIVESDAVPSDAKNKTVFDTVTIVGYGIKKPPIPSVLPPLIFPLVSICDNANAVYRIENNNDDAISIASIRLLNEKEFSLELPIMPINVQPQSFLEFTVHFSPVAEGLVQDSLLVEFSTGETISAYISGVGKKNILSIETSPKEFMFVPGKMYPISINIYGNDLFADSMNIALSGFGQSFVVDTSSVAVSEGMIDTVSISEDGATVYWKKTSKTLPKSVTLSFDVNSYLGNSPTTEIFVDLEPSSNCFHTDRASISASIDDVCFRTGRFISPSGIGYVGLSITPEPVQKSASVHFTLGLASLMRMALYNVNGEIVQSWPTEMVVAGSHSREFIRNNLSDGLYFLTIQTPLFCHSLPMLLVGSE